MIEKTNCELCGEPMPEGEEMFKYHGYSGDCPKKPLTIPHTIPDLKKQVREEFDENLFEENGWFKELGNGDEDWSSVAKFCESIIDRTLAFAKEATTIPEEPENADIYAVQKWIQGFNAARQAQLKKWDDMGI